MNETTVVTRSGTLDLLDPNPADVRIEDIAFNLARINRWNGCAAPSLSVARHSLLVQGGVRLQIVFNRACAAKYDAARQRRLGIALPPLRAPDPHLRLCALLHDAAEAYIGDICRPVKAILGGVMGLERRLLIAIGAGLGVPRLALTVETTLIKEVDNRWAATEARNLLGKTPDEVGLPGVLPWPDGAELLRPTSEAMDEEMFLAKYRELRELMQAEQPAMAASDG